MHEQQVQRFQKLAGFGLVALLGFALWVSLGSQGPLILSVEDDIPQPGPADRDLRAWFQGHAEGRDELFHVWDGVAVGPMGFAAERLREKAFLPDFERVANEVLRAGGPFLEAIPLASLGDPGGSVVFHERVDQLQLRKSLESAKAGIWLHMAQGQVELGTQRIRRLGRVLEALSRGDRGHFSLNTYTLALSHRMNLSKAFAQARLAGLFGPSSPGYAAWKKSVDEAVGSPWLKVEEVWAKEKQRIEALFQARAQEISWFDRRKRSELGACQKALEDFTPAILEWARGTSYQELAYPEGTDALQLELKNVLRSMAVLREFPQRISYHLEIVTRGEVAFKPSVP